MLLCIKELCGPSLWMKLIVVVDKKKINLTNEELMLVIFYEFEFGEFLAFKILVDILRRIQFKMESQNNKRQLLIQ
ncbi:MAG: hypothetical protein ACI90V_013444 [Bacillariaceae sp.]|jgi:hypothetical protein